MSQEMSTILQFLGFLTIGLMSVTIPTYAISISYLGRETEETLNELRRRRELFSVEVDRVKTRIKQETSETALVALRELVTRYEKEEGSLRSRLFFLSAIQTSSQLTINRSFRRR